MVLLDKHTYTSFLKGDLMIQNSRILILTGSYGNGHLKVSKTLKETLMAYGCNEVIESDLYLEAHPLLTKATKFLYIKSFTYGQKLYGSFYYAGNKEKVSLHSISSITMGERH